MPKVKCKCQLPQCGKEFAVWPYIINRGEGKFCNRLCRAAANIIHGSTGSHLYHIWGHMCQRCSNPNSPNYEYYGGRGIAICVEWKESFDTFRNWSMINGYAEGLQIDRIDVNGNYEPANCRFVTHSQNMMNRRLFSSNKSGYKGVTLSGSRWVATITANGITKQIGTFDNPKDAAEAYDAKAKELHGEFACLNFPDKTNT